jgi:hypothetical protein
MIHGNTKKSEEDGALHNIAPRGGVRHGYSVVVLENLRASMWWRGENGAVVPRGDLQCREGRAAY